MASNEEPEAPPPPLPARNGAAAAVTTVEAQEEISPVTILPHDVIEKLAELDLELSEGKLYNRTIFIKDSPKAEAMLFEKL